ncbi:MAG: Asp-tRNA(Asn)/Glu-tRNA(Gln) amidotransferase subunit GatA [Candidatus Rokubacteria bacterium]|nr:Asp-tRNA(Asn)/Glu-tRNA(Gln) amidotransferase subunit GatA [Candidatus Rokubacteria bacterium]
MTDWTLASVAADIRAGRLSPVEATRACLDRIARLDGRLRAFITLDGEGALATARTLEADARAGRWRGPLHGVPLAFKDLCHIRGLPSSCGTKTPHYFFAEAECTAVRRLVGAGAVTLGKLNMSELAMGPFGDNAHHGDVQNPWRLGHCAGGSSSGSGAAVAAGLAMGALGTDTGGSIRLPAGCCGIVGLKPTYGRVSRAGVMPLSWSMDHVGPMALTVRDVALLLGVIAGHDPEDATSSPRAAADYAAALGHPIAGLRVGVPENYYFHGVDPEMEAGVRRAAGALEEFGARVSEVRIPDPGLITDVANIIARAESAAIHSRLLRERPQDLQPAVRARLELGVRIPAHDYLQALRLRARLAREFIREVFSEVDALAAPVIPEPAPALADVKAGTTEDVTARMKQFSRLTRPWNGLGLPALSVPCGFSGAGLPLGFQIVGRPFDEVTVLRLGHAYEQAAGWHLRRPPLDH